MIYTGIKHDLYRELTWSIQGLNMIYTGIKHDLQGLNMIYTGIKHDIYKD